MGYDDYGCPYEKSNRTLKHLSQTINKGKQMAEKALPKQLTIFDIRTVEVERNGKKEKVAKVQFAKDIKITYKGQEISLGEYNSGFLKKLPEMEASLDYYVEKNYMNEEEAQEKKKFFKEKNITSQFVVKTQ